MKKIFFKLFSVVLGVSLLAGLAPVSSAQPSETFFRANRHYAEGDYEKAISLYERMRESGIESGPLYYNLGNAYFKSGRLGMSILNYERARRLLGQDEDLLANLSYVKSLREQEQPRERYRWYEGIVIAMRDFFPADRWALFFVALYNLFFILFILALLFEPLKKRLQVFLWLFGMFTLVSAVFASAKIIAAEQSREGIIVQNVADVRYSPSPEGAVAFQLREGIKAQVGRCENGWCHIRLTRDKSGWVEAGAVEVI